MKKSSVLIAAACVLLGLTSAPVRAQSMSAESLDGPVTANELTSFKNYINASQPNTWTTVDNMANELSQYTTASRMKALGQMYEMTHDVEILNRFIYFCDVILTQRNDIMPAPLGQHVMWTGTITHDWIQSQTDPTATGNAPAGDGAGHLAYCAQLILQTPALLDQVVPDSDLYNHGKTYGQRAATFLAEADDVFSSTILPYYLNLAGHGNRMYFSAAEPYQSNGGVPWNQQAMFSPGFMHLAKAHEILGDNPALVAQYDGIVSTALNWFFNDAASHLLYTDALGNSAAKWGYNPTSYSTLEDNNHGHFDSMWVYRCYAEGRYGVTVNQLLPYANTLCDVMMLGPKWMAGKVDGTTSGSGNSGPTTYVRDGWYFMADVRPDKYYDIVTTSVVPGGSTTNVGAYTNFLYIKNLRYQQGYRIQFSPTPVASTSAQTVSLATTVPGASIRYTLDGSTPTPTTGISYAGPFTVTQTTAVKAIAYTDTWTSPVSIANYVIWAAAPTFSPSAGSYTTAQTVTISSATPGATIRYTTDLSTPTPTTGTLYTGPFSVSSSKTIRAIAYTSTLSASDIRTGGFTISSTVKAATPTFSPGGGTYSGPQTVTISTSTAGATIYYTTDGSAPSTSSAAYTGPIVLGAGCNLQAMAVATGFSNSSTASANYTIGATYAPTFVFSAGPDAGTQAITLTSGTPNATIMFTIDGSTPTTTHGYIYTGPFVVSQSVTVKALAFETYFANSPVTDNFSVAAPLFSVDSGTYTSPQSVTLWTTTGGATIRYTTDGSTPTSTSGTVYTGPITIAANTMLKAIAYAAGLYDSAVSTATYAIQVAAPTFDPPAGTYFNSQSVALATTTSGAAIYYTLDGSTPSSSNGTIYASPISVTASTTIRAIAVRSGQSNSDVSAASYTIGAINPYKSPMPTANVTVSAFNTGFPGSNAVDGSLSTRWAGKGDGVWIRFDLGAMKTVDYVKAAWYQGTTRTYTFDIQTSSNGSTWTTLLSNKTNTATNALETYDIPDTYARYVRIVGHGNTVDTYANVTEAEIWVDDRGPAATPSFSVAAGTYDERLLVLVSSTAGASIRYTLDGTTPTSTYGTLYTSAIPIDLGITTIKAVAYSPTALTSPVASAKYTIIDDTAPALMLPDDMTVEATGSDGAVVEYTVSAVDNFNGPLTPTSSPASGSHFPLGTTPVIVTATDSAGNKGTDTFNVTVVDTTPPTLTVPANITVEATNSGGAFVTFAATASDVVNGDVPVSYDRAPGALFPLGTTVVNVAAIDAAGNGASSTFTVTVIDTTAPVLALPANQVVEAIGSAGATADFAATATDAVGVASLSYSIPSGNTFPLGITTVKVTATDAAGNKTSGTFTVTVRDTTAPALTVPANQVLEAAGPAGATATYSATATDAVGVTSLTYSVPPGTTLPLGVTTVVVTASDAAGNHATGSFTVTVRDTIAPALTAPSNQVLEATSAAGAVATYAATVTDAVGVTSIAYSKPSGSTFPLGVTTVTVTATDAAGNQSTGTFTITVRDTTAPVITSLTASPDTIWPPNKQMVNVTLAANATDAVGITSLKIVGLAFNELVPVTAIQVTGPLTARVQADRNGAGSDRIYTFKVEARDAAGNTSIQTVNVTVPHDQGN